MKKSTFICLLFISSSYLFAQENDNTPTYNNEWGLNITAFASQFFSFNGNDVDEGAFLFTYKNIKNGKAFRLGAGLLINHAKTTDEDNNAAPLTSDVVDVDVRVGLEKQFDIGRKWLFTAGGDFLIGYRNETNSSSNSTGDVKIKATELSAGIGPVLGIHFRITPRVSIGTEGTIYLQYFSSKSSTDFGIGGQDSSEKTVGVNFATVSPLALYFAVRL